MSLEGANTAQNYLEKLAAVFDEAGLFFGHGTDNAWDEVCWLVETLARRKGMPPLQSATPLPPALIAEVEALAALRLSTRKPLAYLLQEAWFCDASFYVDERVLVPRSPFAELIRNRFEPLLQQAPKRILDLCSGGGCIGIACALAFPEAEVVLADISTDALAVASINIDKHRVGQRVQAVQSDLFEKITGQFDLILSNPPYVGAEEYAELPPEYLQEPKLGLFTGNDGLEIPLKILEQAAHYLTDDGLLILETGATWPLLDEARNDLPLLWLEFEQGGDGICAIMASQLRSQSR